MGETRSRCARKPRTNAPANPPVNVRITLRSCIGDHQKFRGIRTRVSLVHSSSASSPHPLGTVAVWLQSRYKQSVAKDAVCGGPEMGRVIFLAVVLTAWLA